MPANACNPCYENRKANYSPPASRSQCTLSHQLADLLKSGRPRCGYVCNGVWLANLQRGELQDTKSKEINKPTCGHFGGFPRFRVC